MQLINFTLLSSYHGLLLIYTEQDRIHLVLVFQSQKLTSPDSVCDFEKIKHLYKVGH